jgi:hypothetical protein
MKTSAVTDRTSPLERAVQRSSARGSRRIEGGRAHDRHPATCEARKVKQQDASGRKWSYVTLPPNEASLRGTSLDGVPS